MLGGGFYPTVGYDVPQKLNFAFKKFGFGRF